MPLSTYQQQSSSATQYAQRPTPKMHRTIVVPSSTPTTTRVTVIRPAGAHGQQRHVTVQAMPAGTTKSHMTPTKCLFAIIVYILLQFYSTFSTTIKRKQSREDDRSTGVATHDEVYTGNTESATGNILYNYKP
jgi:hypothetical protein